MHVQMHGGAYLGPPLGGRAKGRSRFAARFSPRVPPPPRAAPGVGHAAPGPLGLRPLCALAHGPRLLPTKRRRLFGWKF